MILWVIVALVIVGNLALFMVYRAVKSKQEVAARTMEPEFQALQAAAEPEPVAEPEPAMEPEPIVPLEPAVEPESAPQPTNTVVLEPPEPDRPEFRLKTIVIHPTRPSAMINNRVAFVGDRVAGYTVVDIRKDEVTLRLDDDEVVVSLP